MTRIKTPDAEFDGKTVEELRASQENLKRSRDAQRDLFRTKTYQAQIDRIQRIIDKRNRT